MWMHFDGGKRALNLATVTNAFWLDGPGAGSKILCLGLASNGEIRLSGDDARLAWHLLCIEADTCKARAESHA